MSELVQSRSTRLRLQPFDYSFCLETLGHFLRHGFGTGAHELLEDIAVLLDSEQGERRADFIKGFLGNRPRETPGLIQRTDLPWMYGYVLAVCVIARDDAEVEGAGRTIRSYHDVTLLHFIGET